MNSQVDGQQNTPKVTGARALVECLKLEDVKFVFGVPGGQTLSIMDCLFEEPGIRFITTRHECAAAHMADAYGRLTGSPGIALATAGPGATNLLTAVGGAHRDSSPCIIITCNNRRRHIGLDDNQDADHVALFKQFTKMSRFVPDAEGIPHAMREAFRIATTGNPGPVHLDFARDAIESAEINFKYMRPSEYRANTRPVAAQASLRAAIEQLERAERPVIWAGRGAIVSGASAAIVELAEKLNAPVVTTFNGISAVPGDHPLVFGPRSRFGTKVSKAIITEADCILAVGNSFNAASTSRWTLPLTQNIVHIDIDPQVIGRQYPITVGVVGDATDALNRIASGAASPTSALIKSRENFVLRANKLRESWRVEVFPSGLERSVPIKPQWVMQLLAGMIDDQTVLISDAGNPGVWTHMLPIPRPGAYMKPVGFGNMGFGLPAAIAAKLAAPERHVVAVIGDGSLGMSLCEIETAVRERTQLSIVLLNDLGYGNIKQEELHYFGQRYIGVDFGEVDYAGVAKCMGADGEKITDPSALAGALKRARTSSMPYLVDVRIDANENVWKEPI